VCEAASELKNSHVTPFRRPVDFARVLLYPIEVTLRISMQIPIRRIERNLHAREHARRRVNFGEQHQAVGTASFDSAHMMIRCP